MLHEVILVLCGSSSSVVNADTIESSKFISPCEVEVLKRILKISNVYKKLKNFMDTVKKYQCSDIPVDTGKSYKIIPGMYIQAFCDGLNDSLEPYRKNVVSIEKSVLQDPYFSLTGVLANVSKFEQLLCTLNSLVTQIVDQRIHGCQILQHVHDQLIVCGIETIKSALSKIMYHCHRIMLRQLSSWLLYGSFIDPHSEFFIQESKDVHSAESTHKTGSVPESIYTVDNSVTEYRLSLEFLPSYIPLSIANKALFVGSTILLFSKDPRDKKLGNVEIYDVSTGESEVIKVLEDSEYNKMLNISVLEKAINNIHSSITQRLLSVANDAADLYGQLKLMKDIYLLGHGELFVEFLHKAQHILSGPVAKNSSRDLNNVLDLAAHVVHLNSESILEKFTFKIPGKDTVPPGTTVWSVLRIEYKASWPLHLLFTPHIINCYNTLFKFLLQVKLAELKLHDVWISNIKEKRKPLPGHVWQLCNSLMFVIHNLQYYLHLDVLDSQNSIFQDALKDIQDFEHILHAHNVFITEIITKSFLLQTEVSSASHPPITKPHPVNRCLMEILSLCNKFCNLVSEEGSGFQELSEKLDKLVGILMLLITDFGTQSTGTQLSQLLLRLDYNRFFSSKTEIE